MANSLLPLRELCPSRRGLMHEILLVEDSDSDAESMERALRQQRIANPVVRLNDGTQAMEFITRVEHARGPKAPTAPSVLLLDLRLPGFSGFDILADIRNRAAFSKTLKVVYSNFQRTEEIKRSYAAGAQSFLTKPIQLDDLRELIKTFPDYWLLQ